MGFKSFSKASRALLRGALAVAAVVAAAGALSVDWRWGAADGLTSAARPFVLRNVTAAWRLRPFTKRHLLERHGHTKVKFLGMLDRRRGPEGDPVYAFDKQEFLSRAPELRSEIVLPQFLDSAPPRGLMYIAIGGSGAGVQFHKHSSTWSVQVFGRKRFLLYAAGDMPPRHYPPVRMSVSLWLKTFYHELPRARQPLSCVCEPGDLIYVPESWYHATLSIGEGVGISGQNMPTTEIQKHWFEAAKSKKDPNNALTHYKAIARLQPDNKEAWYEISNTLDTLGRIEEAIMASDRALELSPDHLGRHAEADKREKKAKRMAAALEAATLCAPRPAVAGGPAPGDNEYHGRLPPFRRLARDFALVRTLALRGALPAAPPRWPADTEGCASAPAPRGDAPHGQRGLWLCGAAAVALPRRSAPAQVAVRPWTGDPLFTAHLLKEATGCWCDAPRGAAATAADVAAGAADAAHATARAATPHRRPRAAALRRRVAGLESRLLLAEARQCAASTLLRQRWLAERDPVAGRRFAERCAAAAAAARDPAAATDAGAAAGAVAAAAAAAWAAARSVGSGVLAAAAVASCAAMGRRPYVSPDAQQLMHDSRPWRRTKRLLCKAEEAGVGAHVTRGSRPSAPSSFQPFGGSQPSSYQPSGGGCQERRARKWARPGMSEYSPSTGNHPSTQFTQSVNRYSGGFGGGGDDDLDPGTGGRDPSGPPWAASGVSPGPAAAGITSLDRYH
eukprot:gene31959-20081_t